MLTVEISTETEKLQVEVTSDARLRTTARWTMKGDTIYLRVPTNTTRAQLNRLLQDITPRISKQRSRSGRRSDANLMERAKELNATYFHSELKWNSIRWVGNMRTRLGSCTTGGTTDGDIRISSRIQQWPRYVLDYVIAHEICHRKYPNHSPEFWAYLNRYPYVQKALGFIEGMAYAAGQDPDQMLD